MKINEVVKITGLTKKAIRLYEDRGLITVGRSENGYRDYLANDIKILEQIKLLRTAGVSITDIKLLLSGMLSLDDIIEKRKKEIDAESGLNSERYAFCKTLAQRIADGERQMDELFVETEDSFVCNRGALAIGIDIGTTTVSAAVIDLENKTQVEVFSVPHNSYVESSVFSEQSVSIIIDKAKRVLELIYKSYTGIVSIGVTGQMHGILYLNSEGEAVSNLINWQDKRGDITIKDSMTACQMIKQITGENIATGYGISTHYYNLLNGLVPQNAIGFCSIMDYFAMCLCHIKEPVTHTSVAASFGLFDVKKACFKLEKILKLGIDEAFLPKVISTNEIIGRWNGIPVCVAIGDNQASFLGSVKNNRENVLVNMGTGSQISAVGESEDFGDGIEYRPFINGELLLCGSALCGGSAYAMIEGFFRSYAVFAGLGDSSQYGVINALAERAYKNGEQPLWVDTSFCGTRTDPMRRGSIENIELNNFTPSALILGVMNGMCDELYKLYREGHLKKRHIVASGGAIRKNHILRRVLEDKFGMAVSVNAIKEEAATGAALFSAYSIGMIEYKDGFADYINYIEQENAK
ncbi:MAG: MerR family transcriptional regulator [Ruminococcaceae bacterium]|nr:MerR family transcriptional regulator [Oscillospiraceae bacterium]